MRIDADPGRQAACRDNVHERREYTELTRELFFASNNVKRFKTLLSMSNVKTGLRVPMADC